MQFRRRSDRLILIVAGVLFAAALLGYWLLQRWPILSRGEEADRVLLTTLTVVIALLGLSLLFLILRNLIKLLVERRRHVVGSRFRTKLVFIFLVLVLIPSVLLFYAAINLILQINESLFTGPLQEIVDGSKRVVDDYNRAMRSESLRAATRIAREIDERRLLDPDRSGELRTSARGWIDTESLGFVAVYGRSADAPLLLLAGPAGADRAGASAVEPTPRLGEYVEQTLETGEPAARLDRLDRTGGAQQVSALSPIPPRPSGPDRIAGVVVAGRAIPPETALRTARIAGSYDDYHSIERHRPAIKRVYIGLFALLTLLVIFAATWTGFYLARQITVPIQALAEGTQAISAGNLDYRVQAEAGDEIGTLIDSFNRMTGELRASREAIENSRRQLEASNLALQERRHYIEQLLENVPAGVLSIDERGVITTLNRAGYRILGLQPERPVTGMTPRQAFPDGGLATLVHEIEDLPQAELLSHVREFQLSIEGRPVNLAANLSSRRDAEGRYQGALIVIEDLSPVIRAQKTAAWREVARRIAHEIKNPLTPIQLSAQRILKKFHEGTDEYPRIVEEGVRTIVTEVNTLKQLVDEFSRFARMPAVAPVPTDPNSVILAAVALYDGLRPGIVLETALEISPPQVPLDADQMKRALVNLIDNAIAAMEGKGTISVKSRSIAQERLFRIEIADDGPGIDPENKERLFVPYFSTKKRGTGLGLAIVNRIISDHNGFIRVEDNRPRGSRFIIDLPA